MKECNRCHTTKDESEFYAQTKNPRWRMGYCKACRNKQKAAQYEAKKEQYKRQRRGFAKTVDGFTGKIWDSLNKRTINGSCPIWSNSAIRKNYLDRGIRLEMTRADVRAIVSDSWASIEAMWKRGEKPSIDRIKATEHYSVSNVQIIPLSENIAKANRARARNAIGG